jgi:predicted transglutaminase-like cysteine proteinase
MRGILGRATAVLAGALVVGVAGVVGSATAHPSRMVIGGTTSQPIGHYEFCKRLPDECSISSRDVKPEIMSDSFWSTLGDITLSVNKAVLPKNDIDAFGQDEYWTYPGASGDCEDYVLLKRRKLLELGAALSNLLITVVKKPDGEGHAVLTVRTDQGDFILDNLSDKVLPWDETGYRYLKRQAANYSGGWVTIREGHVPVVAAVE